MICRRSRSRQWLCCHNLFGTAVLAVVASVSINPSAYADQLTLTDGRIIQGTVIQESETSIRFKMGSSTVTFPRSRITSVMRSEPKPADATSQSLNNSTTQPALPKPSSVSVGNTRWPDLGLPADFKGTRVGTDVDPDEYDPERFDLEKEVARIEKEIQAGLGVPPVLLTSDPYHALWKRETYQPIIDAAREARLRHGNPYRGETTNLPPTETIVIPGNVTGKDRLTVRYVRGGQWMGRDLNTKDLIWGWDEDIVYLVGSVLPVSLRVAPGTIILFSQFQDDMLNGALSEERIREHAKAFERVPLNWDKYYADLFNLRMGTPYAGKFCGLEVEGPLVARGRIDSPIVMVSDAEEPTPYDYAGVGFWTGILDYSLIQDCDGSGNNREAVVARCRFDNSFGDPGAGPGWKLGNYFGAAWAEALGTWGGDSEEVPFDYGIKYNIFNNDIAYSNPCSIDTGHGARNVTIRNNTIIRGRLQVAPMANGKFNRDFTVDIKRNNFLMRDSESITNAWFRELDASGNYWGNTREGDIRGRFYTGEKPQHPGTVRIQPVLSIPVAMPFLTGIPEIDAVYVEPGSNAHPER